MVPCAFRENRRNRVHHGAAAGRDCDQQCPAADADEVQRMVRRKCQALERLHLPPARTNESLPAEPRQPFGAQAVQSAPEQAQDEENGEHWLHGIHYRLLWKRTMRTARRPLLSANSAKPMREPAANTSTVSPAGWAVLMRLPSASASNS